MTLPETGPAKAAAHIGVDQADLAWLMALLLGEDSRLDTADQWPRGPFALRAPFGAEAAVTLDVKRLDLPGGEAASDARLPITIAPDRVAITQATGKLFGGAIKLDARFTSGDSGIGAAASMALSDAALERMAWALDGGQTAATGRFDLSAQVSGSGRSWLGLVSSLDGDGSFAARGGVMRGLSTDAFAKTLKAASSGLEIAEPTVSETFGAYLAAAPLAYENFEGEFTIEDGIVSARNIALDAQGANAKVSAFIDLPGRKIDSEWQISPDAPDEAAVPPVALVFAGPLGAPERSLDVHALTGFLTVRRLEADLERLEDAQADAREREFFDRKLDNLRRAHMERVREQREKARAEAEAREQERKRQEAEAEERARQEAEAEERARQEHEAEIRKQEQVDEQGRPTASDDAQRQPGPGASLERPDEEKSAAGAADEPASVETPQQADQRRRDALERLVEEALRDSAPPGATFSTPPATTNATREGEIIREALPPPRPPAAIPNGSRGDAPAAQAAPEEPPARREAAAGKEKDASEDDAPPQTVPPAAQPAPPSQKSIRLEFDPLGSGR